MPVNEELLYSTINRTIKDLNEELERINDTGIYFAPELHVAFCIGKELIKKRSEIFGDDNIFWDRERDLKNGGPSDIIFEQRTDNKRLLTAVIELKLRDTYDAYEADIRKLMRLDIPACKKYFCVLLDSFTESNDERLIKLESEFSGSIKRINQDAFKVRQNWYKSQVYCVLNLYEVLT